MTPPAPPSPLRWELAAENIAVKIRWLGLFLGYLYVNTGGGGEHLLRLNAILAIGLVYTLLDTIFSFRGSVFLGRHPLSVSLMEALFIGLLCYFDGGLRSWFHYYYFLSIICCAVRHPARFTYITCGFHCASVTILYFALDPANREPFGLVLMLLILNWITWAATSMAVLIKRISDHLGELNAALRENQALLEERIDERTGQLQEAQAQLLHQEKMAAFGLLAAGIAHEVGNPLTSISTILQMLNRRTLDDYTKEKLDLVGGQLRRIQSTLRELINFSRPASTERERLSVNDVVEEALGIAKYYKDFRSRSLTQQLPADLPPVVGLRGQLVQVFLNLILNAVDATAKGGTIAVSAATEGNSIAIRISDNGSGINASDHERLFQPYFTTKTSGTGLGLFVTRKLLADHNATINCESEPGQTAFIIRIPAAPPLARLTSPTTANDTCPSQPLTS